MATKKSSNKSPIKKTTVKKSVSKRTGIRRHVHLRSEDQPFLTFKVTKQTLYWVILGTIFVLFTIWILRLQADIQEIYNQIDINSTAS